jgi:outer membrane protein TolC
MILRHIRSTFLLALAGVSTVSAQHLTLQEAINAATANNLELRMSRNNTRQALAQYHQSDAAFLPQINISYTALNTDNPLNAFAFKLQQTSITQNDFNPALLNKPGSTSNYSTQANIQQPLVNLDMWLMRKAAKSQIEIAQLQQDRITDYIRLKTKMSFMQLQLAYDVVSVLEEAVQTAEALYLFTENRYKQGYLQKSDLLNSELHLKSATTQLATAKSNIKDQSDALSVLMNKPIGITYVVDSLKAWDKNTDTILPENRKDFLAMRKAIRAQEQMIQSAYLGFVPRINAFGNYQLNDKKMTGFGNNSYLIGLQLNWNLFPANSLFNTAKRLRLQREHTELSLMQMKTNSESELEAAKRRIADADYQISQSRTAVEQAAEALEILRNRFSQGLAGSTDLLMAQTQLAQQKLNFRQSILMLNMSIAYLQFLTAQ